MEKRRVYRLAQGFELELLQEHNDSSKNTGHCRENLSSGDLVLDLENFTGKVIVRRSPLSTKSTKGVRDGSTESFESGVLEKSSLCINDSFEGDHSGYNTLPEEEFVVQPSVPREESSGVYKSAVSFDMPTASSSKEEDEKLRKSSSQSSDKQGDHSKQNQQVVSIYKTPPQSTKSPAASKWAAPPLQPAKSDPLPLTHGKYGRLLAVERERQYIPNHIREARELARKSFSSVEPSGEATEPAASTPVKPQVSQALVPCTPPTRLHGLCSESGVTLEELEDELAKEPKSASVLDARGRTPLHILSDNESLFSELGGKFIATTFIQKLIRLYPQAITMLDSSGRMPFIPLIEDWCIWVYESYEEKTKRKSKSMSTTAAVIMSPPILGRVAEELTSRVDHILTSIQETVVQSSLAKPAMSKTSQFYPRVAVWEEVEFCFEMLSLVMDELWGKNGDLFETNEYSSRSFRPQYLQSKKAREDLVAHIVAVIPTILKTVLLIEDEGGGVRRRLLNMSIFRRLLLSPQSVGPWLTSMLRKQGIPAQRAVDYLALVSQTTVQDYFGGFRSVLHRDVAEFEDVKSDVFESLEQLQTIIASLVVLEDADTERAASCSAVWHLLDRNLTRPFVVGLLLIDFVLHITLMLAVREDVGLVSSDESFQSTLGDIPSSVALFICTHYMIRKVVEAAALFSLSASVFRGYFANIWTILDFLTIILTIIAVTWKEQNEEEYRNGFNAAVVGLLWLRVVGFLKLVNVHMSTFITAVIYILLDLKYFAIVLIVIILMFGDMMSIAVRTKDNGYYCIENADNLDTTVQDFCSNERWSSYLRLYALLIGDFELDSYRETKGLTVLFVLFSVLGVIILLNVLIAVMTGSYERARFKSAKLFGRARISFVAQNQAVEAFLRPGMNPKERLFNLDSPRKVFICGMHVARWLILVSLVATAMIAQVFLASRAVNLGRVGDAWLFVILTIILAIILTVALWIVLVYTFEEIVHRYAPRPVVLVSDVCSKCSKWIAERVARWLFGVQPTATVPASLIGEKEDEELWAGRMNEMERMMESQLARTKDDLGKEIRDLEVRLAEQQALCNK